MKLKSIIESTLGKDPVAKFFKDNPDYDLLRKAIALDDSEDRRGAKGVPVLRRKTSGIASLGAGEAAILRKKGYIDKYFDADEDDTVYAYFAYVTDKGKNMYGLLRKELMSIGYED